MTVNKLRTICKTYNIRQVKKKAQFVENIFQRSEYLYKHSSALDKLQNYIQKQYLNDPAEIHDLYKDYFNLVDLADRHWYSVEEHHRHQKWQCKMVLAMLHTAVANSWVYASKVKYAEWMDWRVKLYKELKEVFIQTPIHLTCSSLCTLVTIQLMAYASKFNCLC